MRNEMRFTIVALLLGSMLALACKNPPAGSMEDKAARTPEKESLEGMTLNGAGASFPFPIYSQWASGYNKLTGLRINYQSIGSGGGIAQIKAGTVDFGASDAPLEKTELDESGLIQFPMVMGGVVAVVNLEGAAEGNLKLAPDVLGDIYLGKVKKWNDKRIKEANPDFNLPEQEITVVHRADGSGTTWIFTNYLSRVSQAWSDGVGTGKAVSWPAGVGGKGNEGVAANVQRIVGSIGYVEFAYALQNKIPYVSLKNREGRFVKPTIESFQSAASSADWEHAPGFYMVLTDQPGEGTWPITGASFILVHREQKDADKTRAMLDFFNWCFDHGAGDAEKLHYVPMPEKVIGLVRRVWDEQIITPDER